MKTDGLMQNLISEEVTIGELELNAKGIGGNILWMVVRFCSHRDMG